MYLSSYMATRIVITGAPASGKTEFVERLKTAPNFAGFIFFEELARQLLTNSPHYRHDPTSFHLEIYRRQIARETAAVGKSFISDRGTLDAFAFHPETMNNVGTSFVQEFARYDVVMHLGSAASLGDKYYVYDDIRRESITDALAIEEAIRRVWNGHSGYHFVSAHEDYEHKYSQFVRILPALINHSALDNRASTTSL